MLNAIKRFMSWYGEPSPNDEYVEDWLQISWWRVIITGIVIGFVPAMILLDGLYDHLFN